MQPQFLNSITECFAVTEIAEGNRAEEIGRLVGGDVSSLSRQHAGEMLDWSRKYREGLLSPAR